MSSCPICDNHKFHKIFDELIAAGGDLQAAKKLCEQELDLEDGKVVSTYRIKQHALAHSGVDLEKIHPSFHKTTRRCPKEVAEERKSKEIRQAVVEAYVDEVATIDIDNILQSLDIPTKPGSMSDVLTVAQQMSLGLNLLAGAIAVDRLKKFAADPEGRRYPSLELKGAEMTGNMMSQAFGFNNAVNLQTAVDTLEKAGYEVIERGAKTDTHNLPPES